MPLVGRTRECALIDAVLTDVRAGRSRTLVVRGAVGTGKTALLSYAAQAAAGGLPWGGVDELLVEGPAPDAARELLVSVVDGPVAEEGAGSARGRDRG
ncbi:AAA family ATPase [Streptomyces cynarae]|uniref:AAA family ATPase n=1 Tax=Streptomyces cynarae TaxID=2981134 RepID=A0ABY6E7R8_9ACTN|nr:AAA family ATPase [Streptomyces cynarae]UXY22687.1 AAA family ATPase [Streptomyces cynarae]